MDLPVVERAFSVRPGDRIILQVPADTSLAQADRVLQAASARWRDVEFMVVAGVTVLTAPPPPLPPES